MPRPRLAGAAAPFFPNLRNSMTSQSNPNGPSDTLRRLASLNLREASSEQLEELRKLSEDDLLRASNSMDFFAVVEALRRHKVAIHSEEVAIKRLTWALFGATVVLVVVAVLEAWRHG